MLRRILVPVDGSELSERALPYAALLAKAQGADVTLLRVMDLLQTTRYFQEGFVDPQQYDQMMGLIREEANSSLTRNREALEAAGAVVHSELMEGIGAASALLDCEAQLKPDLVIMATHGRGGLARFTLGSIADRMVREGSVPVLLVPAFGQADVRLSTALVPLDGSQLAEQVLPMVEALAGNPLSTVDLLTVVGEATTAAQANEAHVMVTPPRDYLQRIASRLDAAGLSTKVTVIDADDAAEAIEHAAAGADLVIMSTHGRGGLDRWRHGSVAERATRQLATPRLLIRARLDSAAGE